MSKLPNVYIYPAIFSHDPTGQICATFPDLGVATNADDETSALYMARDLLGLVMHGLEEDGEPIPAPSAITSLELEKGDYPMMVDVYMPSVRMAQVNKAVKRTVTIPAWLNAKAQECGVNFSQVLQDALKQQLHLS